MKTNAKKELTPEQEQQIKNIEAYTKNHGRPTNRRELLAAGGILSMTSIVLPSALSLIGQAANAATCKASGSGLPGFINVNLAGGASIAGNFRPLDKNGGLLGHYGQLGLGRNPATASPFGEKGQAVALASGVFAGMTTANAGATPTTLAKTASVLFAVQSTDDTANNPIDITPMISKARSSIGAYLPPLGQNRNQPAVLPSVPSLNVGSFSDIQNAIGVNGSIANLSPSSKSSLFRMIASLSETQKQTLAGVSGADILTQLVSEATGKNIDLVGGSSTAIDPQSVNALGNIWNFNNPTELANAAVVYNVLMNNAPAGNFSLGNFDYHQQGRPNQDTKDAEAGLLIGQILESAAILGKPLCVTLTTDGAVAHAVGDSITGPTGDRGTNGAAVAFFFDPTKRPDQSGPQVGAFVSGDNNTLGVDTNTVIGGSPANAQAAILANYLSFGKKAGSFNEIAGGVFSTDQLNQVIKIFG